MSNIRTVNPLSEEDNNMWTAVLFALLVASASAEYGWKPNSEYSYEVHSKTLASLHQVADLYTGVMMKAQVVVTPKTSDHLTVEIPEAQYSHVEGTLPQGVEQHIPQEQLKYQGLPLTKQPFEVKLKNGVVDEIIVSKDVPIWEVNVIKSIVSQLQVDTQGQRLIPSKLNMVPKSETEVTAVYKIMEDTVEGECEVLYDISPLPQYVLQRTPYLAPQPQLVGQHGQFIDIVKTKNFTNCIHRPGYHFGFTGITQWEPTANKMGSFLSRSSVSRVVISGTLKSYTIQSSVTTNQVILSPEIYNNQKGQVYSRVNLTLTSVHSSQGKQQECQNPQSIKNLVYEFNSPWTNDQEARNRWDQQNRGKGEGFRHGGVSSSSSSEESRERDAQNNIRGGRSIKDNLTNGQQEGSSSESYENIGKQDWHQDTPTMTHPPAIPFLPYFVGYAGHAIQHSKEVNVNQIVKKLTEEIGQQLQEGAHVSEKNTLDRFTMLTRAIQTMSVKQLQQATQELYVKVELESKTPIDTRGYGWTAFRDAVAQAGTGPAFTIIKEWILKGQIKGEQAAQVVATLPKTAVYPTMDYMKSFFELVKNEQVMQQEYLNTSTIYAFTTLVRKSQVDPQTIHNHYPVHTFGRPTPKEDRTVEEQYIPYFAQKLQQAVQQQDSPKTQVYIIALGNMAHPKIVRVFEPYLEGKQPMTDYQRTLTIVSLAKLAKTHPRLARSVLYKTYANVGEVYQVRVAAVYNLMKTNPPAGMLQRMARFTHEDPSYQVTAAVKTVIKSYATLTKKDNKELYENAQSAVHLLTPKEYGLQYSHANVTDYVVKGMNLGYTQFFTHIGGQNTMFPETFSYYLTRDVNGYKYIVDKLSGMVSSITVLRDFLGDLYEIGGTEQKRGSQTGEQTFENIYKVLNLEKVATKQIEASTIFEWLGATRLETFDNHTVEAYFKKFVDLLDRTHNKRHFNYQKIYNEYSITIGMPTATGFPFVYTVHTPTYVSLGAQVTVTQGQGVIPDKYEIATEFGLQYSTRTQSKITFITPFEHHHYLAGLDRNVQFYLPLKTKTALDIGNRRIQIDIVNLDEKPEYNVFHFSTWPFISRHNILEFQPIAESSNTRRIQTREPTKFETQVGDKTGFPVLVRGYTDKRFFDKKTLYDLFQRHTIPSIFAFPSQPHVIQHTVIDVVLTPKTTGTKTITLAATLLYGEEHIQEGEQQQQQQQQTGGREVTLAKPTTKNVGNQERPKEFLKKVTTGIKYAEPIVVDLGLEMKGGKQTQYVATVAYASSPVDPQTRVLMYLRTVVDNKNFEVCLGGLTQNQHTMTENGVKAVDMEPKSTLRTEVTFGEHCQDTAQVEIVGKFKRTPERKQYLQQLPLYTQAKTAVEKGNVLEPSVQHIADEASLLDDYHFVMKYQNVPENVKNATYQVYGFLRHVLYAYVSENPFGGKTQKGQGEMAVRFTPDLQAFTTYIHTPVGGINFQNVRVPQYVNKILTPRRAEETIKSVGNVIFKGRYQTTCNFGTNQIRDFGNMTFQAQTGKVWHVAVITKPEYKHTTGETDYYGKKHATAVLVRDVEGEQKEVKLILDARENVVVGIVPEQGGKVVVVVNGQKTPVANGQVYRFQKDTQNGKKVTLVKYYQKQTGELILTTPEHDMKIVYLGKNIRIALGPQNTMAIKGLCGGRTGEKSYFITPQGYVLDNAEQFVATWALSEEGRIGELKKSAIENSRFKKNVILSEVVSEQDAGRANFLGRKYEKLTTSGQDYDSSSSESMESRERGYGKGTGGSVGCNTKRIISIEKGDKHCFSLEPQQTCTSQCHPETTETTTGQFFCVEKSSTSEHWQKMIARGANPDFRNKGNTEEITFEYPVKCTRN